MGDPMTTSTTACRGTSAGSPTCRTRISRSFRTRPCSLLDDPALYRKYLLDALGKGAQCKPDERQTWRRRRDDARGTGARADTSADPRQAPPTQNYWTAVGAESADLIHRVRFGPGGLVVERTTPVGELAVEMEGPHGLQISRDGKYLHMTTGWLPDGKAGSSRSAQTPRRRADSAQLLSGLDRRDAGRPLRLHRQFQSPRRDGAFFGLRRTRHTNTEVARTTTHDAAWQPHRRLRDAILHVHDG